jgi:hypothetical protein
MYWFGIDCLVCDSRRGNMFTLQYTVQYISNKDVQILIFLTGLNSHLLNLHITDLDNRNKISTLNIINKKLWNELLNE